MKETEKEKRDVRRKRERRKGGRKEKKKIPNFISKHVSRNQQQNDTWSELEDIQKTEIRHRSCVTTNIGNTAEMD